MALPRGRGHDRARTQDGEGTAIGRVGVAARLVPQLQAAMGVVVGQPLDQRVQDLVHLAGPYRRTLSAPTPSGGSALAQAGETERLVVLEGAGLHAEIDLDNAVAHPEWGTRFTGIDGSGFGRRESSKGG